MKNSRLKNLVSKFDYESKNDFEILSKKFESEITGGYACFTCTPKFKCTGGFVAESE